MRLVVTLAALLVLVWMFRVEINTAKAKEAAERTEKKVDELIRKGKK